jgi:hypothetical protein
MMSAIEIFRQLSPKDAVENVDCKTCEDCSGDLNPQSIPLGQHFAATMPRFQKPVGVKHVSDAVGGEEHKDSASENLFPKGALVHGPLPATNSSSRNVLRQRLIEQLADLSGQCDFATVGYFVCEMDKTLPSLWRSSRAATPPTHLPLSQVRCPLRPGQHRVPYTFQTPFSSFAVNGFS